MSDEDSGAGEPERTAADRLQVLKQPRVFAVLAGIGLLWLGVWTYSSGSTATGSVGPAATLASAPPTSAHGQKANRQKQNGPTTTPAPPPDVAKTPQAYSTALFDYWVKRDRANAFRVADTAAVKQLFARRSRNKDHWVSQGCRATGSTSNCTWSGARGTLVMIVRNPTATVAVRVVAATLTV